MPKQEPRPYTSYGADLQRADVQGRIQNLEREHYQQVLSRLEQVEIAERATGDQRNEALRVVAQLDNAIATQEARLDALNAELRRLDTGKGAKPA